MFELMGLYAFYFLIFFGYLWNNYGHPNGVKGRKRNGEWNNARDRELVFAHSLIFIKSSFYGSVVLYSLGESF